MAVIMLPPELISKKGLTFHDFPYSTPDRKCFHCWIINVTPPGRYHCLHQCIYCYARDAVYANNGHRMQIYNNLPELVERQLRVISLCPPVSISNASDPCQDIPELKHEVKRLVALLMDYGVSFLITTKGDPSFLLNIPGFISYEPKAISITIEGTADMLALISPGAPPLSSRLSELKKISGYGIHTSVRLDPLFKHLFEAFYGSKWFEQVAGLMSEFAGAGAEHVISSTGRLSKRKARSVAGIYDGALNRVQAVIQQLSPHSARRFAADYVYESGWMGSGYMLRRDLRIELHNRIKEVVESLGMTYATCQELPAAASDSAGLAHCAGVSLPFTRKRDDGIFYPVEGCTANCHISCRGVSLPPCGRPVLTGSKPHRISMLK